MKRFESRRIPGVRGVSKKEARELSKLAWVLDEELSDETWEVRVLPDGRVMHLLRLEWWGNIYPSREALAQVVREMREAYAELRKGGGRFDPAKELLPPLDDFLRDVDQHAKSLAKVVRLPDEVLDRSVESLGAVHKAVVRIKRDKRFTPEVFTPLTAYVGEVMRLLCDGRWGKLPATIRKTEPAAYDPAEWRAYAAAETAVHQAAITAADQAYADAKARRESDNRAYKAREDARQKVYDAAVRVPQPKPIRYREVDEPVEGHEHAPVVWPRGSGDCTDVLRARDPMLPLVKAFMGERSDGTLQMQVESLLMPWINAKRKAAAEGAGDMKHVLRIVVMLLVRACAPAGTSGSVTVDASPWSIVAMLFVIGANLLAVAVLVDGLVHLIRWLIRRLGSARPRE